MGYLMEIDTDFVGIKVKSKAEYTIFSLPLEAFISHPSETTTTSSYTKFESEKRG